MWTQRRCLHLFLTDDDDDDDDDDEVPIFLGCAACKLALLSLCCELANADDDILSTAITDRVQLKAIAMRTAVPIDLYGIAMRTAVPIDLYCYADFDYTVIAVCCNVLYKTHLIAYDGY